MMLLAAIALMISAVATANEQHGCPPAACLQGFVPPAAPTTCAYFDPDKVLPVCANQLQCGGGIGCTDGTCINPSTYIAFPRSCSTFLECVDRAIYPEVMRCNYIYGEKFCHGGPPTGSPYSQFNHTPCAITCVTDDDCGGPRFPTVTSPHVAQTYNCVDGTCVYGETEDWSWLVNCTQDSDCPAVADMNHHVSCEASIQNAFVHNRGNVGFCWYIDLCSGDADCDDGYYCAGWRGCLPQQTCSQDSDCTNEPQGQYCEPFAGICLSNVACSSDQDCLQGMYCNTNLTNPICTYDGFTCMSDADCTDLGYTCSNLTHSCACVAPGCCAGPDDTSCADTLGPCYMCPGTQMACVKNRCYNEKDQCMIYECVVGDDGNASCITTGTPKPDEDACNPDADPCTYDVCVAGVCTHPDVVCPALDQCYVGSCDTDTGECQNAPQDPGYQCDLDDDTCTEDICDGHGRCMYTGQNEADWTNCTSSGTSGWCLGGACCFAPTCCTADVDCEPQDACHYGNCTDNTCAFTEITCPPAGECQVSSCDLEAGCMITAAQDWTSCDGGICNSGSCCHPPDCCADNQDCASLGPCYACMLQQHLRRPIGANSTTPSTHVCIPRVCVNESDQCHKYVCNNTNGVCHGTGMPVGFGNGCDIDDNLCTLDACVSGVCIYTGENASAGDYCESEQHQGGTCTAAGTCCLPPGCCQSSGDCQGLGPCYTGECVTSGLFAITGTCGLVNCQNESDPCGVYTCDKDTGECDYAGHKYPDGHRCQMPAQIGGGLRAHGGLGGLECVIDVCLAGVCTPRNATDGTPCGGGAGECVGGNCSACVAPYCCLSDEECQYAGDKCARCFDGTCGDRDCPDEGCMGAICDPQTDECVRDGPLKVGIYCYPDPADMCTVGTCDGAGTCGGEIGTVKCGVGDMLCAIPQCVPETGKCIYPDAPAGTPCDIDDDICTIDECTGDGHECVATGHNATCYAAACAACDPKLGCVNGTADDGTFCGTPCAPTDTCYGGVCTAGDAKCATNNRCLQTICDLETGDCSYPPRPDGTSCAIDICHPASCASGECIEVRHPNTQCGIAYCNPTTGIWTYTPRPDGHQCDVDNNLCTLDTCLGGVCTYSGANNTCSGYPQCVSAVCDATTGDCDTTNLPADTPCDLDGNLCTQDICNGVGGCYYGSDVTCPAQACNTAACVVTTGLCDYTPIPSGTACDLDNNPCTQDTCSSGGTCVAGPPVVCPSVPCQHGACSTKTGLCAYTFTSGDNGQYCWTDSNQCTLQWCLNGVCTLKQTVSCAGTGPCYSGACLQVNASYVRCTKTNFADGAPCAITDGNPCTTDICQSGACLSVPTDCGDSNNCTVDVCTESGDQNSVACSHTNVADGTSCTGACGIGTCAAGACACGTTCRLDSDCDDHVSCSADKCNKTSHKCYHTFPKGCCVADVQCTSTDFCKLPICNTATHQCQTTAITGCCHDNDDCGDHNVCTTDTCVSRRCVQTPIPGCCASASDCDDSNVCTTDTCLSSHVCRHSTISGCCASDSACDDSNVCTIDTCSTTTHKCQHATITGCCHDNDDCGDHNVCTTDSCSSTTHTCQHAEIIGCCTANSQCDDSNPCTADACCSSSHTCQHTTISGCCTTNANCIDSDPCTADKCVLTTHTCTHVRNATACRCTSQQQCAVFNRPETCQVGMCTSGSCVLINACDDHDCRTIDTCAGGTCQHTRARTDVDDTDGLIGDCARILERRLFQFEIRDLGVLVCPQFLGSLQGGVQITSTPFTIDDFAEYLHLIDEGIDPEVQCVAGGGERTTSLVPYGIPFAENPCADDDPCTVDVCNPMYPVGPVCLHYPMDCDDQDLCTDEMCVDGVCEYTHKQCPGVISVSCTTYECFRGDGLCYPNTNSEHLLDSGVYGQDRCNYPFCVAGAGPQSGWHQTYDTCDDYNPCTDDSCVSPLGVCLNAPVDCWNGNNRTTHYCDREVSPHCVYTPLAPGATLDRCHPSSPNVLLDCNDHNPCTLDPPCDVVLGCVHPPAVNCTSSDPCAPSRCNPASGRCVTIPMLCLDGDPCTDDVCAEGVCYNPPKSCDDQNACTDDVCNPTNGRCGHVEKSCNDHDACTLDACTEDGCSNTLFPCLGLETDLETQCLVYLCNSTDGVVVLYEKNCTDDNLCTVDECVGDGECTHVPPTYRDPMCAMPNRKVDKQKIDEEERWTTPTVEERVITACRVDACMIFTCLDEATGNHTWTPAPAGTPCDFADLCNRSSCNAYGYCTRREGATCPSSEAVTAPVAGWVWAVVVIATIAGLFVIGLVIWLSMAIRRSP